MTLQELTLDDIKTLAEEAAKRDALVMVINEELEQLSTEDLQSVLMQIKVHQAWGGDE